MNKVTTSKAQTPYSSSEVEKSENNSSRLHSNNKITVAMSGGVDSSVAAALTVEKYGAENVFGVTMKLFCYSENSEPLPRDGEKPEAGSLKHEADKSCCSLDAISDAAAICKQLGIPHYVINLEKEFERDVITDFVDSYQQGLTPNPCVRCNQLIKFDLLLRKVEELGADKLVTGHYARVTCQLKSKKEKLKNTGVVQDGSQLLTTSYKLLRGKDELKDQSYFLYNLTQEQLAHIEFPIGEMTKVETRKLAKKYGLKTAEKTESQDICFVPTTVSEFLTGKVSAEPGNIANAVGKIVGQHNGLAAYTIGQRKGLGGGFTEIMYVIGLDASKNEVIIGPEEALYGNELIVSEPHWIDSDPNLPLKCTAKIRYGSPEAECVISKNEKLKIKNNHSKPETRNSKLNSIKIEFAEPQKAITPGQSVVFYQGDEVLGGGIILSI